MIAAPAPDPIARADALLRTPQPTDHTAEAEAVAWALKAAVQAAWTVDPPQAAQAQAALQRLAQALGTPTLTALAAWGAGIVGLARGDLLDALQQLDLAARTWLRIDHGLQAAQVGVARLMPLSLLGRYDEALASGADTEAALTRHGDLQGAAKVALNLGSLAIHRGRHDEAAGHYRRAAVRFARAGDREHSVMADVGLADALGHGSRLDEAARIYDRAGMRARQHGLSVLAAQADHGRALLALGAGRYRAALAGLVRARSAFERIGVDHYLTEVERDLADAYLDLNLLPEALAIYDRLIDRLQAQDNGATLPWLILQRARAEARAGQAQRSAEGLRRAGELFAAQAHPTGQALARLALLELCGTLVQTPEDSRTLVDQATAMAATLPPALQWRRMLVQATAWRRLGQPDEALRLLQGEAASAAAGWPPQGQPRLWDEIGRARLALGEPAAAREAFEQAVQLFEQWQAALPGEEFQLAALADHLHPFEARLALSLDHEPPSWVLAWLDRHRARVLGIRLGRGQEDDAPADAADAASRDQRARLHWIRRQARRRAEDGEDDLPAALLDEAARLEQALLEQARRDRLAREEGTLPPGAAARRLGLGLDLGALRRRFVGPRALIEYGLCNDELFAVLVVRGQVHVVRALASWAALKAALHRLHYQLDTLRAGGQRLQPHAEQLMQRCMARLQALYDQLWRPLQPLLAAIDDAVVVPCQALQALPFPALHDGSQWLDERVRITLAPAAALAPVAPLQAAPRRALVVGDGRRLAHMRHEIDTVARQLQAQSVLMDDGTTPDAVLAAARQADVLHLACHGEFRADNPRFSALHLGEGLLTAADVEAQRLPARLVVLSACETGRTQATAGDEGLGLVRAFQLAGARDVVASLWAVDDEATAHFMASFYAAWDRGAVDVASALQRARSAVRARWPHPFHWAAFQGYARAEL